MIYINVLQNSLITHYKYYILQLNIARIMDTKFHWQGKPSVSVLLYNNLNLNAQKFDITQLRFTSQAVLRGERKLKAGRFPSFIPFFSLFFSVSWDDEINIIQVYIAETGSYHLKTFQ